MRMRAPQQRQDAETSTKLIRTAAPLSACLWLSEAPATISRALCANDTKKRRLKKTQKRHMHFLYNYLTTDLKLGRQVTHMCVDTADAKAKRKTSCEAYKMCRSSA